MVYNIIHSYCGKPHHLANLSRVPAFPDARRTGETIFLYLDFANQCVLLVSHWSSNVFQPSYVTLRTSSGVVSFSPRSPSGGGMTRSGLGISAPDLLEMRTCKREMGNLIQNLNRGRTEINNLCTSVPSSFVW